MKVDTKSLKEVRKLLKELEKLENAMDVLSNYDAKVYANFWTGYNSNTKIVKEVEIRMPEEIADSMKEYVQNRIFEIKKELESM